MHFHLLSPSLDGEHSTDGPMSEAVAFDVHKFVTLAHIITFPGTKRLMTGRLKAVAVFGLKAWAARLRTAQLVPRLKRESQYHANGIWTHTLDEKKGVGLTKTRPEETITGLA